MKKAIFFLAFLIYVGGLSAQDAQGIVEEGTVFTLGTSSVNGYDHINFPKKHQIIKRGAIANFSALAGKKVVAERIRTKSDGTVTAVLKREDGQKFFRFYPSVTANIEKALEEGELKLPKTMGKGAIAK